MVNSRPSQPSPERTGVVADSRKLEILVGRILFWGGLLSILIVLTGFGLHLLAGAAGADRDLVGEVTGPDSGRGQASGVFISGAQIIEGLGRRPFDPLAIIALGLVILLTTPVLAVVLAVPAFAVIRDYRYLVISVLILAILAASFLIGA